MSIAQRIFNKLLAALGYVPVDRRKRISRKDFFDLFFATVDPKHFFFVQIGANDGKLADPLYPYVTTYGLAGLALEPLPRAFVRLQETYRAYPQVRCRNYALATEVGDIMLYAPQSDDPALSSLASLRRDTLEETLRRQASRVSIEEHRVKAVSFDELLRQEKVSHVDLVQIDCEGYDWEVLRTLDLGVWKPRIINFESALLSEEDRQASRELLEAQGYAWFEHGLDTCAYKL